jgi:hypothetical protein
MENKNLESEKLAAAVNATGSLPEVDVFFHRDFGGPSFRTNLNIIYIGDAWNDQVSSFVIVSGKWQFYKHRDFIEPMGPVLGPGYYPWVGDLGIENDAISSYRCVEWTP